MKNKTDRMFKIYFVNEKTKGTNVTFIYANTINDVVAYSLNQFGDNFIEAKEYKGYNK
jgi:hypothetical protein